VRCAIAACRQRERAVHWIDKLCVAVCCSILQCFAVRLSVLKHVAVCCSALQSVAACCSEIAESCKSAVAVCAQRAVRWIGQLRVLQCVAVRCSALQCVAVFCRNCTVPHAMCAQRDADELYVLLVGTVVCCSAMQCVAVRCSALHRVTSLGIFFLYAGATASRGSEHD